MTRYVDGDKLMEHWQEWDWWDKKGMPHCFGYIPLLRCWREHWKVHQNSDSLSMHIG